MAAFLEPSNIVQQCPTSSLLVRANPGFEYTVYDDIKNCLGQGQNGTFVFLGLRKDNKTDIAVKVTQLTGICNDPIFERSLEEILKGFVEHVKVLDNEYIVKHFGMSLERSCNEEAGRNLCCGDHCSHLLLEYCSKGNLLKKIKTDGLNIDSTVRYAKEIITGICYLHGKNVCHLDIKGANILLTHEDRVKICDFETIVRLGLNSENGQEANVRSETGTVPYMAPEMINPDHGVKGLPADIYSFGCVLIEMLSGDTPQFADSNGKPIAPDGVLFFVGRGGKPTIPETSDEMRELVDFCIKTKPSDRETAEQVLDRLHRIETTIKEALLRMPVAAAN